jgi:hypothetical protein
VSKQERNNLFNNKARKYAKMCSRGKLLLSIITVIGLIGFVKVPEKLSPQVPVSRPISTSKQIPASTPNPPFEQIPTFTPSPSSEQMPAVEVIPASEEVTASTQFPAFELITVSASAPFFELIPVVTTNETEPAPTLWRLPEDEQNFSWTSVPYIIFSFLILFVMVQCLRQYWHGEYEREHDWTQLPRNLQVGEIMILQLRDIVASVQEVQDKHIAQLDDELECMEEEIETRERYLTELQNVIDSVKTRINARNNHLAQLESQMGLMESFMKAEGERCAQIEEGVHSLKMVAERWVSMPMEQMVDDPVSMEHSYQDEDA